MAEQFMSVEDAAAELGRSIAWVRRLAQNGRLPGAEKVGRDWIIPKAAVAGWKPESRGRPKGAKNGGG